MFEQLNKALIAEGDAGKAKATRYINSDLSDDGLRRYLTAYRLEQYRNGDISRQKARELATARMIRQEDKHTRERLEKLERVAAAPDLEEVIISVEWVRSRTWGYNPHATVTVKAGGTYSTFEASASGCGYDKRTAAIGSALNQSRSVLKMLYLAKENGLKNPPETGRFNGVTFDEVTSNSSIIHYGAGYGILPYFEGGVGISSFYGVFEACGFRCTAQHETKRTDYYVFTRTEV